MYCQTIYCDLKVAINTVPDETWFIIFSVVGISIAFLASVIMFIHWMNIIGLCFRAFVEWRRTKTQRKSIDDSRREPQLFGNGGE